jgi:hypothetical protein
LNHRRRLENLERKMTERMLRAQQDGGVCGRIAQYEAYYRSEGPRPSDPPCPPGQDPAAWERHMRIGRCLGLPNGEYPPDMSENDRQRVAELRRAFENAARREMEPPVTDD